jgi:hypothetical protein
MIDPSLPNLTLAYLDPGSGALLLQMLVAGVAGVVVFFKYQGRRVKDFFSGSKGEVSEDDTKDGS